MYKMKQEISKIIVPSILVISYILIMIYEFFIKQLLYKYRVQPIYPVFFAIYIIIGALFSILLVNKILFKHIVTEKRTIKWYINHFILSLVGLINALILSFYVILMQKIKITIDNNIGSNIFIITFFILPLIGSINGIFFGGLYKGIIYGIISGIISGILSFYEYFYIIGILDLYYFKTSKSFFSKSSEYSLAPNMSMINNLFTEGNLLYISLIITVVSIITFIALAKEYLIAKRNINQNNYISCIISAVIGSLICSYLLLSAIHAFFSRL